MKKNYSQTCSLFENLNQIIDQLIQENVVLHKQKF